MAAEHKRFSVSVPPSMEEALTKVKKEYYGECSQNDMVRDLIIRGLEAQKEKMQDPGGDCVSV